MTLARAELEALTSRVATRIMASFAEVTAEVAEDVLVRASCLKAIPLKAVDEHLAEHPSALVAASPHVPVALVRLAHALNDLGVTGVVLPPCAECGAQKNDLPYTHASGGRMCRPCGRNRRSRPCAWCGRVGPIGARRPDGGICGRCAQADPASHETCASCGKVRRVARRLADGRRLCQTCRPKPLHECSGCGSTGPAHAITNQGPICGRVIDILSVAVAAAAGRPGSTIAQPRTCQICAVAATPECKPSARSAAGSAHAGAIAKPRILCAAAAGPGRSGSADSATSTARSGRSGPRAPPASPAITRSARTRRSARVALTTQC
jgi:hypothetical protein